MILGQSIYKLALCFTLYFAGGRILNLDTKDHTERVELNTIIFNTFVWMQIFNELNCRRLDNRFNIFEGIQKNYWFFAINAVMVGGQILIIFVGGAAFHVTRLNGAQWAVCIVCGFICIPWAGAMKCIPDSFVGGILGTCTQVIRALGLPVRRACSTAQWVVVHRPGLFKTRSGSGAQTHGI